MDLINILEILQQNDIEVECHSQKNIKIDQVAGLKEATKMQLSFFNDIKRVEELKITQAGLILIQAKFIEHLSKENKSNYLVVKDPYLAYAVLAQAFNPVKFPLENASSAIILSDNISSDCHVGHNAVIEAGVVLQEQCVIEAGSFIGKNCQLGRNVHLAPNVTIMDNCIIGDNVTIESGSVIGGQGFGFANNAGQWVRIPQIGRVVIGSNIWIGNNCAIDRGAINDTIIADNCIIDNLVHIAHNVEIGEGSALAGQVGFAGSTKVGKYNIFAGQVGVAGHITLADGCQFGAKSGVTHTIKNPGSYSGFPAIETPKWQKMTVRTKALDKTAKKLKALEKQIQEIQKTLEE